MKYQHLHYPVPEVPLLKMGGRAHRPFFRPAKIALGGTLCWEDVPDPDGDMVRASLVVLNPDDGRRLTTDLDRLCIALRRFNAPWDGAQVGELTGDGHCLRVAEEAAKALQRRQNSARVPIDCSRAEGRRRVLARFNEGRVVTLMRVDFDHFRGSGEIAGTLAQDLKLSPAAVKRAWALR